MINIRGYGIRIYISSTCYYILGMKMKNAVMYNDSFSDGQTHLSSRKKEEEEERNLMV